MINEILSHIFTWGYLLYMIGCFIIWIMIIWGRDRKTPISVIFAGILAMSLMYTGGQEVEKGLIRKEAISANVGYFDTFNGDFHFGCTNTNCPSYKE